MGVFLIISIAINIFFIVKYIKIKKYCENSEKLFIEERLNEVINSINKLGYEDSDLLARDIINRLESLLKVHCKTNYCTILRMNNNVLTILNSNVGQEDLDEVYKYCAELLDKSQGSTIIDTYCDYKSAKERNIKSSYFMPVKDVGAVYIESCTKNIFKEEIFKTIVKAMEIILYKSTEQDKLSSLAMKDNLTGIYNRNYMWEHIEKLKKESSNLLLAIMDVDYFKKVNDVYGHYFGDIVLKSVSNYVKSKLDVNDEIYRYGGEEFVITFKNQDISEVENKLNNIRIGISKLDITDGRIEIRKTASFGVTNVDKQLPIIESIKKADNALYQSKENGRNTITINI